VFAAEMPDGPRPDSVFQRRINPSLQAFLQLRLGAGH
jgi:hypothetical protein